MGKPTLVLFCLSALAVPVTASVQEPERTGDDPDARSSQEEREPELPTLDVTITVSARSPSSTPQLVTVIDRETIDDSGARTVGELLPYAPALFVLPSGSRGGLTTAQIRGGDPNFTLVLLDGVPLNDSTDPLGGAVNLESLPLIGIERIEIARGPMSFYHGSAALAGVINLVTERSERDEAEVRAEIEAGNASAFRTAGSFSDGFTGGDYFAAVQWEEEAGRVAEDRFQQLHVLGNLGLKLGEHARLRLGTRLARWESDDYPEASGGPLFGSGEVRRSEHNELSVRAELQLGEPARRRHRLTANVYQHDLDRASPGVGFLVPPSVEKTRYTRTRVEWATELLTSQRLHLNAGADLDHENARNESVLQLPLFFGGDVSGDYVSSRTTPGAFAELIAEPGKLVVDAGVRFDFSETTGAQGSPRLGMAYRFNEGATVLRGSAARAFKLPSFFALASPAALGGNPDLKPETTWGQDVGIEQALARGLRVGANFFYNRYRDLVDFDFESFQHINRSSVRSRGVELALTWKGTSSVDFQAQVTWNEVEDLTTSMPLLHRPRWLASGRMRWQPRSDLTLWFDARAVSETLDRQLTVPERERVAGYGVVGLAGSWRFSDRWEVRGRIDNLSDRQYESLIGFPGPGRSARVGLRYTFHRTASTPRGRVGKTHDLRKDDHNRLRRGIARGGAR